MRLQAPLESEVIPVMTSDLLRRLLCSPSSSRRFVNIVVTLKAPTLTLRASAWLNSPQSGIQYCWGCSASLWQCYRGPSRCLCVSTGDRLRYLQAFNTQPIMYWGIAHLSPTSLECCVLSRTAPGALRGVPLLAQPSTPVSSPARIDVHIAGEKGVLPSDTFCGVPVENMCPVAACGASSSIALRRDGNRPQPPDKCACRGDHTLRSDTEQRQVRSSGVDIPI